MVKAMKYFGADVKNTIEDQTIPTIPKRGNSPVVGVDGAPKLMHESG